MSRLLNGKELAEYVKDRQAKQVRNLRQEHKIELRLAIVVLKDDPVIETYVRLKERYGADIGIAVDVHRVEQAKAKEVIKQLNEDDNIQGIIVQLPIADPTETQQIVNYVAANKDVDALGEQPEFDPATPTAILWLLAGYNVDLREKHILIVGRGRLVGAPLERMLKQSGMKVKVVGRDDDLKAISLGYNVIITATGKPGLITPGMIRQNSVVVDAGVASEAGKTVGDVHPAAYARVDLTITPRVGGVGPLTVCALFDNVIRAARRKIDTK